MIRLFIGPDGEDLTIDEAVRRVCEWTRDTSEPMVIKTEELGDLITDIKGAIFYLSHAFEAIIRKDKQ